MFATDNPITYMIYQSYGMAGLIEMEVGIVIVSFLILVIAALVKK